MNDSTNSPWVFADDVLKGRSAFVTGAGSGIGAACARALARAGATVTVCDVNETAAKEMAEDIGGKAWVADLADTAALDGISLETDILVNCAGIQHVSPVHEFDPEKWRFIQRLMLEAPFLLTRAALPHMYTNGFGRIINVSSVHGIRASAYKSAYVAVKHGLEGFSKVVALEGAEHGVTSNCVNPGYVKTALVEKQIADQAKNHGITEEEVTEQIFLKRPALKRLADPEEVAGLVVWLASDAAGMVTGATYTMDGAWSSS